jgi:hypothetical protein
MKTRRQISLMVFILPLALATFPKRRVEVIMG